MKKFEVIESVDENGAPIFAISGFNESDLVNYLHYCNLCKNNAFKEYYERKSEHIFDTGNNDLDKILKDLVNSNIVEIFTEIDIELFESIYNYFKRIYGINYTTD